MNVILESIISLIDETPKKSMRSLLAVYISVIEWAVLPNFRHTDSINDDKEIFVKDTLGNPHSVFSINAWDDILQVFRLKKQVSILRLIDILIFTGIPRKHICTVNGDPDSNTQGNETRENGYCFWSDNFKNDATRERCEHLKNPGLNIISSGYLRTLLTMRFPTITPEVITEIICYLEKFIRSFRKTLFENVSHVLVRLVTMCWSRKVTRNLIIRYLNEWFLAFCCDREQSPYDSPPQNNINFINEYPMGLVGVLRMMYASNFDGISECFDRRILLTYSKRRRGMHMKKTQSTSEDQIKSNGRPSDHETRSYATLENSSQSLIEGTFSAILSFLRSIGLPNNPLDIFDRIDMALYRKFPLEIESDSILISASTMALETIIEIHTPRPPNENLPLISSLLKELSVNDVISFLKSITMGNSVSCIGELNKKGVSLFVDTFPHSEDLLQNILDEFHKVATFLPKYSGRQGVASFVQSIDFIRGMGMNSANEAAGSHESRFSSGKILCKLLTNDNISNIMKSFVDLWRVLLEEYELLMNDLLIVISEMSNSMNFGFQGRDTYDSPEEELSEEEFYDPDGMSSEIDDNRLLRGCIPDHFLGDNNSRDKVLNSSEAHFDRYSHLPTQKESGVLIEEDLRVFPFNDNMVNGRIKENSRKTKRKVVSSKLNHLRKMVRNDSKRNIG